MGPLIAREARCISTAQFTASTTLEKSASKLSPAVPDDPPAMCRDQRVDSAAELAKRPMRAFLILSHPASETDQIRLQNGGKFPLPSARFEDLGHRPSDDQPKIGATHTADAFGPIMCNAQYPCFVSATERLERRDSPEERAMSERYPSRLKASAAMVGLMFLTVLVPSARSEEPKLWISGYDPVAYFTDGKPVQGKSEF